MCGLAVFQSELRLEEVMKEPFKPGDRVRVRGYDAMGTYWDRPATVMNEPNPPKLGVIAVKDEGNFTAWVHAAQCRRLKPRRKAREWWIL